MATILQRYNIHARIEMTTTRMVKKKMMMMSLPSSSRPLNVLMSIFGGGGGDIDHRVGAAASLLLRVDS